MMTQYISLLGSKITSAKKDVIATNKQKYNNNNSATVGREKKI